MSALHIYDMERWLKQAEIAAAMSIEALLGNMKPYSAKLHELRGFKGAVVSAQNIRKVIEGSDLLTGKMKTKVQDAYSMRSTPQVIGAAHDAIAYARSQVEIELNGVGDNPIFVPELKLTLTGANFQGSPVSLPMDMAGAAITMVSVLSERRMNRLTNPALSQGLPDFLAHEPGFYSGMMLSQYTADHLIVEQRILSQPASIQSIPAAADQEDFVSMGMNTALKNGQIIDNAYGVLGIEFIAAGRRSTSASSRLGRGRSKRAKSFAICQAPRRGPALVSRSQPHEGAGGIRRDSGRSRESRGEIGLIAETKKARSNDERAGQDDSGACHSDRRRRYL